MLESPTEPTEASCESLCVTTSCGCTAPWSRLRQRTASTGGEKFFCASPAAHAYSLVTPEGATYRTLEVLPPPAPPSTCKEHFDAAGSLAAGLYTVMPADEEFSVWCTSDGRTRVLYASTISQYQGSGAVGTPSASAAFKLSDAQISQLLQARAGVGMQFACGSYAWTVPDWAASGYDATGSTYSPGAWQMQYPPRGTSWYQGYQIGAVYGGGGNALETRLSNSYGTSYPACRVHNVGDYDLTVWVI